MWVDRISSFGSYPPYAKLAALTDPHISIIYVSPEDPLVTAARMDEIHSKGFLTGMTSVPRVGDPITYARTVDAQITKLGNAKVDVVMLDIEVHDAAWIRSAVTEYRRLRPGKATDFTNEPFQDGRWGAAESVYPFLIEQRLQIFPQLYYGDMRGVDPIRATKYVEAQGVPLEQIHGAYDGQGLPSGIADGLIFTAERLLFP